TVGKDSLPTIRGRGDFLETRHDGAKRCFPAYTLEFALAFAADAPQRIEHPLPGVGTFEIARDLGAEHAVGRGMIGRTFDLDRAAVLDGNKQRTSVWAVVRARTTKDRASLGGAIRTVEGHRPIVPLRSGSPAMQRQIEYLSKASSGSYERCRERYPLCSLSMA